MKESLKQRFLNWICTTFGHKFWPEGTRINSNLQNWSFNGRRHGNCRRCGHTITKPIGKYTGDPTKKLHPGEPYFFIRGQDVYGPVTVATHAQAMADDGDDVGAAEVGKIAVAMKHWQNSNPTLVKKPD